MERTASQGLTRRLLLGAGGALAAAPAAAAEAVTLRGPLVQGGCVIGRTAAGAEILVNGETVERASSRGLFVLGLDRDEPETLDLHVRGLGLSWRKTLAVEKGAFGVQRVDGVPQSTVTPTDPALLERIRRETALKTQAFASVSLRDDFEAGFRWPLDEFRVSSRFGNQRILNGVPGRPHYGVDLAAPAGTAIRSPAPGLVVLAEPAMHFEGGLTLIDHGHGLIAAYLHQSRLLVKAGDRVRRDQIIGKVGRTGRATGPHLCWRLKWRGRNMDPSLFVFETLS